MRTVIGAVMACLFAGMGVVSLSNPGWVVAQFGVERLTAAGRNEVRAVYGGFGLAVAGLLSFAASTDDHGTAQGIFLAIAVALGGMALGRVYAFVIDELPSTWFPTVFYFIVELAGAALLGIALVNR